MGKVIAHVGAFDIENYGDLLFSDVLKKQLEKRIEVDKIIYFAPNECKMPNTDRKVYSLQDLEKMHLKYKFDAIVLGGGDFVHLQKVIMKFPHLEKDWTIYDVLYMWVIPSLVSDKYNIPLLWNCPGVPLEFSENDSIIVDVLCNVVDYISVRDSEAKKVLEKAVEANRINVVPDSVLSIRDVITRNDLNPEFESLKLDIDPQNYVFFQGNSAIKDNELEVCANTLKKIKEETGYKIILQSIGYSLGDYEVLEKIYNYYPRDFILCKHHNQYEILSLISNASLYIGTSLHGGITANSYGVNNILYNVNRYNKIEGFAKLMDREKFMIYEAKDMYSVYKLMKKPDERVLNNNITKINKHFAKISEIIENKEKKPHESKFMEIAEYIYNSNQMELEVKRLALVEEKYNELNEKMGKLERDLHIANYKYEEIINSTSWKITQPIRRVIQKFR